MHSHNDESKKANALRALAENFGGRQQMSADLVDIWLELLSPYSAEHVSAAVRVVIAEYEYKTIPPFAVLKRALDDLTGDSEKAMGLQAAAEWQALMEAVPRVGSYRTPDLHPTTAFVVRAMGGWGQVCAWEMSALDFKRRDFLQRWKDAHGKTDLMALGADGAKLALAQAKKVGATQIGFASGQAIAAISAGEVAQ